jgi:hypothetical protein
VTRDRDEAQHALVKVKFVLDPGEWHGSATETLWAAPVGQNQYRLENSPFYAFGVSYQDVVAAQRTDNELEFVSVVSRGGHSTYRILVQSIAGSGRDGHGGRPALHRRRENSPRRRGEHRGFTEQ